MIAMYGVPGGSIFGYVRVRSRAEGEAWFDQVLAAGGEPTQAELNARRQARVLTELEARAWVSEPVPTAAQWLADRHAVRAAEALELYWEWLAPWEKTPERRALLRRVADGEPEAWRVLADYDLEHREFDPED